MKPMGLHCMYQKPQTQESDEKPFWENDIIRLHGTSREQNACAQSFVMLSAFPIQRNKHEKFHT